MEFNDLFNKNKMINLHKFLKKKFNETEWQKIIKNNLK